MGYINSTLEWYVEVAGNPNLTIPTAVRDTVSIELSTSINSLFCYGSWTIKGDQYSKLEEGDYSIGKKLRFNFIEGSAFKIHTIELSILNIITAPGLDANYVGQTVKMELISPWYFDQFITNKAYKGTISEIIKSMMDEELPKSLGSFDIKNSYDNKEVIRYRTLETQGEFITSRLLKNAKGQYNTPIFAYTTLDNKFIFKDLNSMRLEDKFYALDHSNTAASAYLDIIGTKPELMFYLISLSMQINDTKNQDLWGLVNPAVTMTTRSGGKVIPIGDDTTTLPSLGFIDYKFTMVTSGKDLTKVSKVYSDDSLSNDEDRVNTIANKYQLDLLKCHKLELTGLVNLKLEPGKLLALHLYTDEYKTNRSLFSQVYIIESVSHMVQRARIITTVTLTKTSFNYREKEKVSTLLSLE